MSKLFSMVVGLGGTFSRARYNLVKLTGVFYSKPKSTNKKFIDGVLIEDIQIPSIWLEEFNKNITIDAQIFLPEINTKSHSHKLPIMLHIHGGGFVLDDLCSRSTEFAKLGMIVISLHYRLAPEYKFPTAIEDAYSALSYIFNKEHELLERGDISRVVLIGDSAGGNLAAVLPLIARDRGLTNDIKIAHQILIYPTMVHRNTTESLTKHANGYILTKYSMDWFHDQYIDDEKHFKNPYVNPLMAESLQNLPPALIILATDDILYDDGKMYGEALRKANVTVEFKEYVSVHGFFSILGLDAEEIEAFKYIVEYLKRNGILES